MLDQSKAEADGYHRFLLWLNRHFRYAAQNVLMLLLGLHDGSLTGDDANHRRSTGHSGQRNLDCRLKQLFSARAATFLSAPIRLFER
jgi:hypothetical protein